MARPAGALNPIAAAPSDSFKSTLPVMPGERTARRLVSVLRVFQYLPTFCRVLTGFPGLTMLITLVGNRTIRRLPEKERG